jgi:hypothetical protein
VPGGRFDDEARGVSFSTNVSKSSTTSFIGESPRRETRALASPWFDRRAVRHDRHGRAAQTGRLCCPVFLASLTGIRAFVAGLVAFGVVVANFTFSRYDEDLAAAAPEERLSSLLP